jgi:hypothetical protein
MKTKLSLIALLAWSPAALAVHPRNLTPIENGAKYVLVQDYVATEKAATFTLKAGTYVAAFENRDALFLVGSPNCLGMHVVPPKQPEHAYTMQFNCGVYYPKDESTQARFFYIRGAIPPNPEFGWLLNAIVKAGEGAFQYPIAARYVVGLRLKLHASQP